MESYYLKKLLFRALAMDFATLVLPTPGGPDKHTILPCTLPDQFIDYKAICVNFLSKLLSIIIKSSDGDINPV